MSSGERGKPAANYKEKNPFDISRRSETEVAAEIAQRMAAWKQARGRSYAASAAASDVKPRPAEAKPQPSQSKPHIAAPVQPARLPKISDPVAHRQQPAGAGERVPLFAVRRAMPPAPSLRQRPPAPSATLPAAPAEPPADKLKIDSLEIAAPLLETLIAEHPGTEAAKAAAEALRTQRPEADPVAQVETPSPAFEAAPVPELETPMAAPEPRAAEMREDQADAPTVPHVDAPVLGTRAGDVGDWSADATDIDRVPEAIAPPARDIAEEVAAIAESASEPLKRDHTEAISTEAPSVVGLVVERKEPAAAPIEAMEESAHAPSRAGKRETESRSGALVARWEDSVAAVSATPRIKPDRDTDAPVVRRDENDSARPAPTLAGPALDEHPFSARRDDRIERAASLPESSERDWLAARRDEAPTTPAMPVSAKAVRKHERASPEIEMPRLDAVAMEMHAAEAAMVAEPSTTEPQVREDPHLDTPTMREREIAAPSAERPTAKEAEREIAIPADLVAKANTAQTRARGLPRMETRIEQRRIDTLRADPWIAGRRPVFPHIDPDVWDVPPPEVAARARRRHSGTGWAIGLGAALLIAGITAPAALWQKPQQSPSDLDQVVTLPPPATTQQPEAQATPPSSPPEAGQQAASQEAKQAAPVEAAPQPAIAEPPAPAVQAPSSETASAPQPSASPSTTATTTAQQPTTSTPAPEETTALSAIKNQGELNAAPITAPPAPKISAAVAPRQTPASQPKASSSLSAEQVPDPMVPHPFVPEAAPKATPFRPGQTAAGQTDQPAGAAFGAAAGAAAVADINAPTESMPVASAPITGGPATIALKPSLGGQLKPMQTADSAARPVQQTTTRKPKPFYPQSLDQMFQNLIDTLSEGQPVNPASKPLPPGNRR